MESLTADKFKSILDRWLPGYLEKRFLLAVSGGVDSMVLLELMRQVLPHDRIYVAHVNYGLRGKDSDLDEKLVRNTASQHHLFALFKKVDLKKMAENNQKGIQELAREIRYQWFEEIRQHHQCDFIVTGHHFQDNAETILLNLLRGSGLKGIMGMQILDQQRRLFRPLLQVRKQEILAFAERNKLEWREDKSNQENYYQRNFLRNQIAPLLEKINPKWQEHVNQTAMVAGEYFSFTHEVFQYVLTDGKIMKKDGMEIVDKALIREMNHPALFFYHWLNPYGIRWDQIQYLLEKGMYSTETRNLTLNNKKQLVIDRKHFILTESQTLNEKIFLQLDIRASGEISKPFKLRWEIIDIKEFDFNFDKDPRVAYIDYGKLEKSILIRHWQPGDSFIPLGMKGRKKLSDFFIDQKLNEEEKKNTWIFLSENNIFWVAGYRIDQRFRVNPLQTQRIIKFYLLE
ncbi:MAG: tRNA(Ile)-lysidine synthase [Vicingaceae bacterium]|nr:MAG: tRNA(Ile)-lysidine synthase [Vicingaceae bacterium]